MDYTNFRSSVGGFRRSDVFAYIEKTTKEHRQAIRALEKENNALRQERDALLATVAELQTAAKAVDSLTADQDSQVVSAPAAVSPEMNPESQELAAYRRAEAVERTARERAEELERTAAERAEAAEHAVRDRVSQLDESMNSLLLDTQGQLAALNTDTENAYQALQIQLDAFRSMVGKSEELIQNANQRVQALHEQLKAESCDA